MANWFCCGEVDAEDLKSAGVLYRKALAEVQSFSTRK
jgi:hypothetical protein